MTQVVGLVLVGVGAALLWSPVALLVVGAMLVVGPEVGAMVRGRGDRS